MLDTPADQNQTIEPTDEEREGYDVAGRRACLLGGVRELREGHLRDLCPDILQPGADVRRLSERVAPVVRDDFLPGELGRSWRWRCCSPLVLGLGQGVAKYFGDPPYLACSRGRGPNRPAPISRGPAMFL
jgi:hypothetical protein